MEDRDGRSRWQLQSQRRIASAMEGHKVHRRFATEGSGGGGRGVALVKEWHRPGSSGGDSWVAAAAGWWGWRVVGWVLGPS